MEFDIAEKGWNNRTFTYVNTQRSYKQTEDAF